MRAKLAARPLLTVVLSAILAASLGFAVAVFLVREQPPRDDSAEAGFARDMSLHHAQAVTMSMYVYKRGGDAQLGKVAYDIALTQQSQIGTMRGWLDEWGLKSTSADAPMTWMGHDSSRHESHGDSGALMPGMASDSEMERLRTAEGSAADKQFCELMIDHHMAGITMAEAIRTESDRPEVDRLAGSMVKGQQSEVNLLNDFLENIGDA